MTADTLVLDAPAKVNLVLEVIARRPDGYHDLEMANITVSLADRLTFRRIPRGIACRTDLPDLPTDGRNLAVRAAAALLGPDPTPGVELVLEKRIPVGAGLAGGSADAAATLRGVDRLFGLRTPRDRLEALGLGLGSDVPFCLRGGAAICEGRGERMTPASCPPGLALCLAWPRVSLSTAAVFGATAPPLTPLRGRASVLFVQLGLGTGWSGIGSLLWNRLEDPARTLCKELGGLLEAMKALDTQGFVMTGSGSAVVALAKSPAAADAMGVALRAALPVWTATVTTLGV